MKHSAHSAFERYQSTKHEDSSAWRRRSQRLRRQSRVGTQDEPTLTPPVARSATTSNLSRGASFAAVIPPSPLLKSTEQGGVVNRDNGSFTDPPVRQQLLTKRDLTQKVLDSLKTSLELKRMNPSGGRNQYYGHYTASNPSYMASSYNNYPETDNNVTMGTAYKYSSDSGASSSDDSDLYLRSSDPSAKGFTNPAWEKWNRERGFVPRRDNTNYWKIYQNSYKDMCESGKEPEDILLESQYANGYNSNFKGSTLNNVGSTHSTNNHVDYANSVNTSNTNNTDQINQLDTGIPNNRVITGDNLDTPPINRMRPTLSKDMYESIDGFRMIHNNLERNGGHFVNKPTHNDEYDNYSSQDKLLPDTSETTKTKNQTSQEIHTFAGQLKKRINDQRSFKDDRHITRANIVTNSPIARRQGLTIPVTKTSHTNSYATNNGAYTTKNEARPADTQCGRNSKIKNTIPEATAPDNIFSESCLPTSRHAGIQFIRFERMTTQPTSGTCMTNRREETAKQATFNEWSPPRILKNVRLNQMSENKNKANVDNLSSNSGENRFGNNNHAAWSGNNAEKNIAASHMNMTKSGNQSLASETKLFADCDYDNITKESPQSDHWSDDHALNKWFSKNNFTKFPSATVSRAFPSDKTVSPYSQTVIADLCPSGTMDCFKAKLKTTTSASGISNTPGIKRTFSPCLCISNDCSGKAALRCFKRDAEPSSNACGIEMYSVEHLCHCEANFHSSVKFCNDKLNSSNCDNYKTDEHSSLSQRTSNQHVTFHKVPHDILGEEGNKPSDILENLNAGSPKLPSKPNQRGAPYLKKVQGQSSVDIDGKTFNNWKMGLRRPSRSADDLLQEIDGVLLCNYHLNLVKNVIDSSDDNLTKHTESNVRKQYESKLEDSGDISHRDSQPPSEAELNVHQNGNQWATRYRIDNKDISAWSSELSLAKGSTNSDATSNGVQNLEHKGLGQSIKQLLHWPPKICSKIKQTSGTRIDKCQHHSKRIHLNTVDTEADNIDRKVSAHGSNTHRHREQELACSHDEIPENESLKVLNFLEKAKNTNVAGDAKKKESCLQSANAKYLHDMTTNHSTTFCQDDLESCTCSPTTYQSFKIPDSELDLRAAPSNIIKAGREQVFDFQHVTDITNVNINQTLPASVPFRTHNGADKHSSDALKCCNEQLLPDDIVTLSNRSETFPDHSVTVCDVQTSVPNNQHRQPFTANTAQSTGDVGSKLLSPTVKFTREEIIDFLNSHGAQKERQSTDALGGNLGDTEQSTSGNQRGKRQHFSSRAVDCDGDFVLTSALIYETGSIGIATPNAEHGSIAQNISEKPASHYFLLNTSFAKGENRTCALSNSSSASAIRYPDTKSINGCDKQELSSSTQLHGRLFKSSNSISPTSVNCDACSHPEYTRNTHCEGIAASLSATKRCVSKVVFNAEDQTLQSEHHILNTLHDIVQNCPNIPKMWRKEHPNVDAASITWDDISIALGASPALMTEYGVFYNADLITSTARAGCLKTAVPVTIMITLLPNLESNVNQTLLTRTEILPIIAGFVAEVSVTLFCMTHLYEDCKDELNTEQLLRQIFVLPRQVLTTIETWKDSLEASKITECRRNITSSGSILEHTRGSQLQSKAGYSEQFQYERDVCVILIQLIGALKYLQSLGIESVHSSLDAFVLSQSEDEKVSSNKKAPSLYIINHELATSVPVGSSQQEQLFDSPESSVIYQNRSDDDTGIRSFGSRKQRIVSGDQVSLCGATLIAMITLLRPTLSHDEILEIVQNDNCGHIVGSHSFWESDKVWHRVAQHLPLSALSRAWSNIATIILSQRCDTLTRAQRCLQVLNWVMLANSGLRTCLLDANGRAHYSSALGTSLNETASGTRRNESSNKEEGQNLLALKKSVSEWIKREQCAEVEKYVRRSLESTFHDRKIDSYHAMYIKFLIHISPQTILKVVDILTKD